MPPFEVPLEGSEMLAFTPDALAHVAGAPAFMLRAATHRDKRQHKRLIREEGVQQYTDDQIRAVTRSELQRLWSPEVFEREVGKIEQYWQALDDWTLGVKDDPELVFEFPADDLRAIDELTERLVHASDRLRRMLASNADANEVGAALFISTIVASFTGLDVPVQIEGGYINFETTMSMRDALMNMDKANDQIPGTSWMQLTLACARRMNLSKDTEKNSVSPSPCDPDQKNLESEALASHGKSPASARSPRKTSKP